MLGKSNVTVSVSIKAVPFLLGFLIPVVLVILPVVLIYLFISNALGAFLGVCLTILIFPFVLAFVYFIHPNISTLIDILQSRG